MKCESVYYETEQGRTPVIEFLESPDDEMRVKAMQDIGLLEEFGRSLKLPQVETVKDSRYKDLYELRSSFHLTLNGFTASTSTGKRQSYCMAF